MNKSFKKIFLLIAIAVTTVTGFLYFQEVFAQTRPDLGIEQVGSTIGLPDTDIRIIITRIIRYALGLLGIVALVLVMYGGFVWMTAGGNEEKIATAKKILLNGVIGLIIILSAYAIVSFTVGFKLQYRILVST